MSELYVVVDRSGGSTFLGKGIVGRPEMGVVVECREVTFDEWDSIEQDWKQCEWKKKLFRTDTGYVFDEDDIWGPNARLEIELYASNCRHVVKDAQPIGWKDFM